MRNDKEIILAILASSSDNNNLTPVQVQKLFFLVDKTISKSFGGPLFDFEAYHYGPFDKDVYIQLQDLARIGEVEISTDPTSGLSLYRITQLGRIKGEKYLGEDCVY